jgi:hypothetical protein
MTWRTQSKQKRLGLQGEAAERLPRSAEIPNPKFQILNKLKTSSEFEIQRGSFFSLFSARGARYNPRTLSRGIRQMENPRERGRQKWGVVGLCFGALAMSSVVRISLGVAAPTLMKEYDISPAAMGYVLSGWNWAYTACQLIIGPVVDRFGSWIVLGVGASVWSLSTIALPLASTALGLFLFRAVFGVGHSMLIPAQGSTISKWFRSEQPFGQFRLAIHLLLDRCRKPAVCCHLVSFPPRQEDRASSQVGACERE